MRRREGGLSAKKPAEGCRSNYLSTAFPGNLLKTQCTINVTTRTGGGGRTVYVRLVCGARIVIIIVIKISLRCTYDDDKNDAAMVDKSTRRRRRRQPRRKAI